MQRSLNYYLNIMKLIRNYANIQIKEFAELLQDNNVKDWSYLDSANKIEEYAVTFMFIGSDKMLCGGKGKRSVNAYTDSMNLIL